MSIPLGWCRCDRINFASSKFQSSHDYMLLCNTAPRPEPPTFTIKDGEQYSYWGCHDVFELLDTNEFEAAMI
jgi:hypothetical protein